MLDFRRALLTGCNHGNGGEMPTVTPLNVGSSRSRSAISIASSSVVFIFQLPRTRRRASLLSPQRFDAGQSAAFHELERRAATGRDVRYLIGDSGLFDGRDRVAAADDREGV